MFLSFMVPIPESDCGLLVLYYGETFGEAYQMQFPDEEPQFGSDNEVLIGYATPVGPKVWTFEQWGGGDMNAEGDPDEPAIGFFLTVMNCMQLPEDDANYIAAKDLIRQYVEQTKEFFQEEIDPALITASDLSVDEARALIAKTPQVMN